MTARLDYLRQRRADAADQYHAARARQWRRGEGKAFRALQQATQALMREENAERTRHAKAMQQARPSKRGDAQFMADFFNAPPGDGRTSTTGTAL